jgi:hypothetical protein
MYNLNNGLVWQVEKPHSIFDETGLGTEALLVGLDRKLQSIAGKRRAKKQGRKFRTWIREMQSDILSLIFHAGEIVFDPADRAEKISLHVLCDNNCLDRISESIIETRLDMFRFSISDYIGLTDACTENKGSILRAFFSSELLIAARSQQEMKMLDKHMISIREIFEDGNVLPDVGMMVAYEISEKVHCNGYEKAVKIDEKEFVALAKEAMRKRRINPYMHEKVMPYVKKAIRA